MSAAEFVDLAIGVIVYLTIAGCIIIGGSFFVFLYAAVRYSARDFLNTIRRNKNGNAQDDPEE